MHWSEVLISDLAQVFARAALRFNFTSLDYNHGAEWIEDYADEFRAAGIPFAASAGPDNSLIVEMEYRQAGVDTLLQNLRRSFQAQGLFITDDVMAGDVREITLEKIPGGCH